MATAAVRRSLSSARWQLDHLVYGVSSLDEGMVHFHNLTGIKPVIGGRHEGLGTHNAIFSLGDDTYFEIIAADPTQKDVPGNCVPCVV